MSHGRRSFKTATRARRCKILVRLPISPLPFECGGRVHKAGICREHYTDRRHAQEARRGTEAVNVPRRAPRGRALPKDPTISTVVTKWKRPDVPLAGEPIETRRRRQGVTQAAQDYLIETAARKRARRAGIDYDSLTRKAKARWRAAA